MNRYGPHKHDPLTGKLVPRLGDTVCVFVGGQSVERWEIGYIEEVEWDHSYAVKNCAITVTCEHSGCWVLNLRDVIVNQNQASEEFDVMNSL